MGVAARSAHLRNGFFVPDDGYEYVLNPAAASVAAAAPGPGRFSVDRVLGWNRRPDGRRGAALALGLGRQRPLLSSRHSGVARSRRRCRTGKTPGMPDEGSCAGNGAPAPVPGSRRATQIEPL
ncbi:hypothetical protein GCM10022222_07370 [Amycolatopsis ultiminotia]|uniref:Uncharacterized protein n=1 Tax=Amycolatopsis ultiminotia TaxID=543629 RepID=A0ABP6V187_9PSEU